jgi:hypothetical protein
VTVATGRSWPLRLNAAGGSFYAAHFERQLAVVDIRFAKARARPSGVIRRLTEQALAEATQLRKLPVAHAMKRPFGDALLASAELPAR